MYRYWFQTPCPMLLEYGLTCSPDFANPYVHRLISSSAGLNPHLAQKTSPVLGQPQGSWTTYSFSSRSLANVFATMKGKQVVASQ